MERGQCSAFLTVKASGRVARLHKQRVVAMPAAVNMHILWPDAKLVFEMLPSVCGLIFGKHSAPRIKGYVDELFLRKGHYFPRRGEICSKMPWSAFSL